MAAPIKPGAHLARSHDKEHQRILSLMVLPMEYIAKDSPQAARLLVQRIHHTISLLSNNPSLGHPGRLPGSHELVIPKTR